MTGVRVVMVDNEARLVLDSAIANARDLSPVMLAIAGELDDRVQESFESKKDPSTGSNWPELKAATVKDRIRKGFNGTDILQRTRILRTSVVTEADKNSVSVATAGIEYALAQFYGSKNGIPARPFAGASLEDLTLFEQMVADFIVGD